MNISPNTPSNSRSILTVSPAAPCLSEKDIEAGKKILRRGSVDLDPKNLQKLLEQEREGRENVRVILIDVAVCCFQGCLRTIQRGAFQDCEKAFGEVLSGDGENFGHFFHRFFKAECKYSASKASKLCAPLKVALYEGLNPTELRQTMIAGWTLEAGYEEARQKLVALKNKPGQHTEPLSKKGEDAPRKPVSDSEDEGKSGSQSVRPKSGRNGAHAPSAKKRNGVVNRDVIVSGTFEPMFDDPDAGIAIVKRGKSGNPRRVEYLSSLEALELVKQNATVLARRRFRLQQAAE